MSSPRKSVYPRASAPTHSLPPKPSSAEFSSAESRAHASSVGLWPAPSPNLSRAPCPWPRGRLGLRPRTPSLLPSLPASTRLCSTTVDSAKVCGFSPAGPVSYAFFFSLFVSVSVSLFPLPAPARGASSFPPGRWAAHLWQGRQDGGAILGLRAFGTG